MFDIYLFPFVSFFIILLYPIFIRYILLPVVLISKLPNLSLLFLYEYFIKIKSFNFLETNIIIEEILYFLIWLLNKLNFLLYKRRLINFFIRVLPNILNIELIKNFNKGCGLGIYSWKSYTSSNMTFPIFF